jgi:lipoprotein signal peptidase
MEKAGEYAFITFVIIAIIAGLIMGAWSDLQTSENEGWVNLILVILGIIVGLTIITEKESQPFLIAAIALIVAVGMADPFGAIDKIASPLGTVADYIVKYIASFAVPAAVIQAIKAVYSLAKTK